MECNKEQIELITEGKCPVCKSTNTDILVLGENGGSDECDDCGAYWSVYVNNDKLEYTVHRR